MNFSLTYEMRNPAWTGRPFERFYRQVLEQITWADQHGFTSIGSAEHHGEEDGYIPAPLTLAAAIAACTKRLRLNSFIVMLPFHHPVAVAEQAALVDIISGGRLDSLTFREGYRPADFAMYGVPFDQRGAIAAEAIQIIRKCWELDEFSFKGKRWQLEAVRAMPKPVRQPRPRINVADNSEQAARMAARYADSFSSPNPGWMHFYHDELRKMGKDPGPLPIERPRAPFFTHVTNHPERDWARLRRHALHDWNEYSRFAEFQDPVTPYFRLVDDPDELRRENIYQVLTPRETIAALKQREAELGKQAGFRLRPAMGGMPVEMGQESLDLVVNEIMPIFQKSAAS